MSAKRQSLSRRRARTKHATGIDISELPAEVTRYTTEHVEDIRRVSREDIDRAGEDCARYVAEGAPKRTGEYARGWTHVTSQGAAYVESVVHNTTKPSLAHLLENGHQQFYYGRDLGYRTPGVKHLAPAYEKAKRELEGRVRK